MTDNTGLKQTKNGCSVASDLTALLCCGGIKKVVDKTDSYMSRARVYFNNGEELSIIRGEGSYGGDCGLFEIMCKPHFYDDYDPNDDSQDTVRGYLTADDVKRYIEKIAAA